MTEGSPVLEPFARVGGRGPEKLRMGGVRSAADSQRRLCVQRRHRSPLVLRCGSDLPMGLPWEGTRRTQVPRSRRARCLAATEVTVWTVPGAEVPGFGSAVTHRLQWQPADALQALPGAGWRDRLVSSLFVAVGEHITQAARASAYGPLVLFLGGYGAVIGFHHECPLSVPRPQPLMWPRWLQSRLPLRLLPGDSQHPAPPVLRRPPGTPPSSGRRSWTLNDLYELGLPLRPLPGSSGSRTAPVYQVLARSDTRRCQAASGSDSTARHGLQLRDIRLPLRCLQAGTAGCRTKEAPPSAGGALLAVQVVGRRG